MAFKRIGSLDNGIPTYQCLTADIATLPTTNIIDGARLIVLDGTKPIYIFDTATWYLY